MSAPSRSSAPRSPALARDTASPLADPSARLAARLLDALLPSLPSLVLLPIGIATHSPTLVHAATWVGWVAWIALTLIDLVLLARFGQTVGKRLVGLRIVAADGTRTSLRRAFFVRDLLTTILASIPLAGWAFALVDLALIFAGDRRTLHDHMAGTIVVDLRAPLAKTDLAEVFA